MWNRDSEGPPSLLFSLCLAALCPPGPSRLSFCLPSPQPCPAFPGTGCTSEDRIHSRLTPAEGPPVHMHWRPSHMAQRQALVHCLSSHMAGTSVKSTPQEPMDSPRGILFQPHGLMFPPAIGISGNLCHLFLFWEMAHCWGRGHSGRMGDKGHERRSGRC